MVGGDSDSEDVIRRNRLSGGPACGFMSSPATDERISEADLVVNRAYTVVLASQGIIGFEAVNKIFAALDEVEVTGHDALSGDGDVHEAVKTAVTDIVGPDDGKIHTARSCNDEMATCIRYHLYENVLPAPDAALALRESLLETAVAHTEMVMPGYVYLQPA